MTFDNTMVVITKKTAGSHLLVFTGTNSKVNFLEIMADSESPAGYTYTRTDFVMLDMHNLIEKVGELADLNTEEKSNIVAAINEINNTHSDEINQLKDDFTNLRKDVETAVKVIVTDKVEETIVHKSELIYGRVDSANGQIISSSIQSVFELDVTGGDIISTVGYYINSKGNIVRGNGKNILCSYAVDSDGARVASASYSYNSNLPSITIPSGVSKIWFSVTTSGTYASTIVVKTTPNGNVQRIIRQNIYGKPFRYNGALTANQVVSLGFEHCWTNKVWMFSGRIGTFGTTKIGACDRTGNIVRPYIEVTETSVNLYSTLAGSFDKTFEHGLTISNDLQIIVKQGRTLFVDELIVQSNGSRWSTDVKSLRLGEPYYGLGSVSDGTFTNCSISANIMDINKPVWVFGDSWTSLYENRWVGQAVNLGFDKGWLLDGHAGRTTEEALEAFGNLIQIRQPKMIVWCMGMNDADIDDDTPNSSWKTATEEVMRICDKYDIGLVLATIPTVPASQGSYSGTARNNNAKNNYIINSGYRYFDQVSALGADRNGNWIDGYWQSDTDHTHPSEMGARALMAQIFADVPEMLI